MIFKRKNKKIEERVLRRRRGGSWTDKISLPKIKFFKNNKRTSRYKRRYSFVFAILEKLASLSKYLTIPLAVLFFVGTFYLVFQTDYFKVDKITFEGVEEVETSRLQEIAKEYKGKNIYSVDLTKLENDVQGLSVYIKSVYARKMLPNKLVVEVDERSPKLVILNFSGVYLVDADEYIISHPVDEQISFTDDEWEIYTTENLDVSIIEDRIVANLKEENEDFDEEKFDYKKDVDEKTKRKVHQEIRDEMNQAIQSYFESLDALVSREDFAGLPRVYFYERGNFNEGEQIEPDRLNLTSDAIDFLNSYEEFSVIKTSWITPFSLQVYTLEEKEFVFGINRDPQLQLEDLGIILNELDMQKKDFQRIDVRSDIIRVK